MHMNPNCDTYWQLLENVCINTDQLNLRKCLYRFKVLEMSHNNNYYYIFFIINAGG